MVTCRVGLCTRRAVRKGVVAHAHQSAENSSSRAELKLTNVRVRSQRHERRTHRVTPAKHTARNLFIGKKWTPIELTMKTVKSFAALDLSNKVYEVRRARALLALFVSAFVVCKCDILCVPYLTYNINTRLAHFSTLT